MEPVWQHFSKKRLLTECWLGRVPGTRGCAPSNAPVSDLATSWGFIPCSVCPLNRRRARDATEAAFTSARSNIPVTKKNWFAGMVCWKRRSEIGAISELHLRFGSSPSLQKSARLVFQWSRACAIESQVCGRSENVQVRERSYFELCTHVDNNATLEPTALTHRTIQAAVHLASNAEACRCCPHCIPRCLLVVTSSHRSAHYRITAK